MSRLPRAVRIAVLALGLLGLALLAPRPSSVPVPDRGPAVPEASPALVELPTADPPAWPPQAPPRKTPRPPPAANPLSKLARGITPSPSGGPAAFAMQDDQVTAFFGPAGVTFAMLGRPTPGSAPAERRGYALRWGLVGAAESAPRGEGERSEKVRRYVGDRSRWSEEQSSYDAVVYDDVRPGVDMTVESRPQSLKYTLHVSPGADASDLRFRYAGAHDVKVSEDGRAVDILTEVGTLREDGLVAWQDGPEGRRPVEARYVPAGPGEVEIAIGEHDPELPLTVDPVIGWSSFLGGSRSPIGEDYGHCMAVDNDGNVYVAGYTHSVDLPPGTVTGYSTTLRGTQDGFLVKINATGIVWSTYIGGTGLDQAYGVAVDASGNPVVTGYTSSADFPTTAGAYDRVNNFYDAFAMKFNGATGALTWSTFLGGTNTDYGHAVAVDGSGNVYIGGITYSTNFPVVGGFDASAASTPDGFVAKLSSDGASLVWSSYLGGNNTDYVEGIALDPSNNLYVVGYTYSTDFPATATMDTTLGGTVDGFLSKVAAAGSSLLWSTYLGGTNSDYALRVAVTTDATPEPVVVGYTYSADFPVTALAYDTSHNGGSIDAFATRVQLDVSGLPVGFRYSTFLGGTSLDYAYGVAPGPSGSVYVSGYTYSSTFPTTVGAYRTSIVSGPDGFVTRLTSAGGLDVSTFLGGSGADFGRALWVVPSGQPGAGVYVAGYTNSANFPQPAPGTMPDNSLGGTQDAFVSRLDLSLGSSPWASYVGGANSLGDDWGYDVAVDPTNGDAIVMGYTTSSDFIPPGLGTFDVALGGTQDAFVTRVRTTGSSSSIVWSTYLGGSSFDYGFGGTVDRLGYPYVVGYTLSADYPITAGVFDTTIVGAEAFVTCLTPAGGLYYSTALGGSSSDYGRAIAVDTNFNAYVTGYTYSSNFPLWNAFKPIPSTTPDGFVTKLDVDGKRVWSSYLGGNDTDQPTGIAVDHDTMTFCVVTGYTYSTDFTLSGPDATLDGGVDAFVTRITGATVPTVSWSRFLGGTNSDYGQAVAVTPNGSAIYAVGYTYSADFPVPSALDNALTGAPDGYVSRLDVGTGNLLWSTYLGGSSIDYALACKADAGGVYVTGYTYSANFPTKNAFDPTYNGSADAFVTRIYADGTSMAWSSFLGGTNLDYGYGLAVDAAGTVYVAGVTYSTDFPDPGGFDGTLDGNHDAFVIRLPKADPDVPDFSVAGAGQYRTGVGGSSIPVGSWTNQSAIAVRARVSDSDDDMVKLRVEIRLRGVDFNEATATFYESPFMTSGSLAEATVDLVGLPPSEYHWRAQTVERNASGGNGRTSSWLAFGGNSDSPLPADRDVGRDDAPPTVTITGPSGTGTFYTQSSSVALSGTSADATSTVTSVSWARTSPAPFLSGGAFGTTSWSVASVALEPGPNVIQISATDAAGNTGFSSITVYRDNTPPTVTIGTPAAEPTVTGVGSVGMSGLASDNFSLAAVVWSNNRGGGGPATFGGGTWSATASGLSPGLNVITVTAQDSAGNLSFTQRTINYDTFPPSVFISSPANGTATTADLVTLQGSAADNVAVSGVSWRNATTNVSGGASNTAVLPSPPWSSWTASNISLIGGPNVLEITATDSVGRTATTSITVHRDMTPPQVEITIPTTSVTFTTGSGTITLGGTSMDDVGVASVAWRREAPPGSGIFLNGGGTVATPGALSTTWGTDPITLQSGVNGPNLITVTITDRAGRTSTDTITVTYDTTAPAVVIDDPSTDPHVTSAASILMSGTVVDNNNIASVTWTNTTTGATGAASTLPALPIDNLDWTALVPLQPGPNVIQIRAEDDAVPPIGTTVTITVIRDSEAPAVKITGPTTADDYYTGTSTLALSGTTSDNRAVTSLGWAWSSNPPLPPPATTSGTITIGSPWTVSGIPLVAGTQTITVTAEDQAGNTSVDTLVVTYDPTLPDVTITSPSVAASTVVTATPLDLGGTASDNTLLGSVTWTNAATGAGGPASGTTAWTVTGIVLSPGANPITVIATDAAGNIKTDTIVVYYDNALPTVTITGPSSSDTHITNVATVVLEGTASDDVGVQSVSWVNDRGGSGTAAGTTAWIETSLTLLPGDNKITVTVTDVAGKPRIDEITIHYDDRAPLLAVTTPSGLGPHETTSTPYALAGTTSDLLGDGLTAGTVVRVEWVNLTTGGVGSVVPAAGTWAASVPLTSGLNTVALTAVDAAGNETSTSLDVTYDPAAPLVTISVPTTDLTFTTGSTPVLLGGTASDDVGIDTVGWSTAAAVPQTSGPASGTDAWTALVPLAPGPNLITITATDLVGRIGTSRITIVYDPTPPSIAVTSPTAEAAFLTTLSPLSIGGAASDNLEVQGVTWENTSTGENGTASGTGAWSIASVLLVEGPNVITVTATDGVGNMSVATITVDYDGTPPAIDLDTISTPLETVAPAPATYATTFRPVTISGTAGDNLNVASVTWTNSLGGGGSANVAGTATAVAWDASVYLYPGSNVITVTATDAHGYTATDVITVNYTPESVAPSISIDGASGGGSISATQLASLTGTADDNVAVVEVRWRNLSTGVRGTAILSPPTGMVVDWSADVPLASGVNVVLVTAVDDAGNTTSATLSITYSAPSDAVLPAVTIVIPTLADVWDASSSPLTLGITASDNVGIAAVTWSNAGTGGDGVATLVGGTTWSATVALAPGANTIVVAARDAAGNTVIDTLIVDFVVAPDAADPTITITSHPTGTTVNVDESMIQLAGTASDNTAVAGVVWSNAATGGTGGADGTATWDAGVVLVDGINVITVRAYDASGRVDTDQITVLYTAPPLPPEVLPSGHCGLLGGEALLLLGLLALRRRR